MVWGWWWAHDRSLPAIERDLFEVVNGLPDGLRYALWPVMQLGSVAMWVVAPMLAWLVWRRVRISAALLLASALAWLGARLVKAAVERGRPEVFLGDTVDLRLADPDGFGFISGHTAIAFALATTLRPYLSARARVVAWTLAAFVGLARVFFGAHLPADVLAGAGFGILCGLATNAIVGVDESVVPAG